MTAAKTQPVHRCLELSRTTPARLAPAVVAMLLAWSVFGCASDADVHLVTIAPATSPELLEKVELLEVWLLPRSADAEEPLLFELKKGEPLRIEDVSFGTWHVEIRGFDSSKKTELVYGRSRNFDIKGGESQTVQILLGRPFAFNAFGLRPLSATDRLRNLTGHDATAFSDGNKNYILVTGGSRAGIDNGPTARALLIDTETLTAQELPPMGCARTGHGAFQIDLAGRALIVIAGGETRCEPSLELFDPARRTFETIETGCKTQTTLGAAAEVAIEGGRVFPTGNVVIPGAEICRVNLLTGESTTRAFLPTQTGPDQGRVASAGPLGRLVILDGHTLLVDDLLRRSVESQSGCYDSRADGTDKTWSHGARYDGLLLDGQDAEVVALVNEMGDFFAVGRHDEHLGFALLTTSECRVDRVTEGLVPHHPAVTDFTLSNIGTLGDAQAVLIAGGRDDRGTPQRSSALLFSRFIGIKGTAVFSTSSVQPGGGFAPTLNFPRAGHAAATLPDGSIWIIGGGDPRAEVFFRGTAGNSPADSRGIEARAPIEIERFSLEERKPDLTSIAILDNSINDNLPGDPIVPNEDNASRSNLLVDLVTESFPGIVFHDTVGRFTSEAKFYFGLAQRGIGAELHVEDEALYEEAHCQSVPLDEPSSILSVERTENGNIWAGRIDSHGKVTSKTSYTNVVDAAREQMRQLAAGPTGCAWRQMLRVGRDAVFQTEGDDADATRPTGVRLLVFASAGDDCSQDIIPATQTHTPPEDIITDCVSPAFDPYFGLPTGNGSQEGALADLLSFLSWRPEDLIVMLVGNPNPEGPCPLDAQGTRLAFPRRLASIAAHVEAAGGAFLKIDACLEAAPARAPSFEERSQALFEKMSEALRPHLRRADFPQSCVPAWLTDIRPTFEDDAERIHPLPVPLRRSARQRALAKSVEEVVSARCRLVLHVDDLVENPQGTSRVFHRFAASLNAEDSHWRVVPDAELDDDCETGWVISLAHDKLDEELTPQELADDVEIHCFR